MREYPKVIGIGSTVYDTLMLVDHYPEEDHKMRGTQTLIQGGGPCATALVAARKLGITTAYMGIVGDDGFGNYMIEDFKHWDVGTEWIRQEPGAISFHSTVLLNTTNGSRTCIWNPGTVRPIQPEALDLDALDHAEALHLDGHMLDAAIFAARRFRESGRIVCHDAGGTYPNIEKLLPYVTHLIPSEEFALKITGESTAEAAAQKLMDAYHPTVLVITQGSQGGIILDEKGLRRYACYPVKAVDSNGCGDTFHGAFLAGILKGFTADEAACYGSAAAAIKCTRAGARLSMPNDEECRAFLQERGVELPR